MAPKTFNLRPTAPTKDVTLEMLSRVEMKRDDMGNGIKPGDRIILTSLATGKKGVGIAFLMFDTSKSLGANSFVKISPELREFMGLDLSDKCSISKYEEQLRIIANIKVSEKEGLSIEEELSPESIEFWVSAGLAQLPAIIPGHCFSIVPTLHGQKRRKRVYSVDSVECARGTTDDETMVPFAFTWGVSQTIIRGISPIAQTSLIAQKNLIAQTSPTVQTNGVKERDETPTIIRPTFVNLPGLEQQLRQLQECLERVNRALDERKRMLYGCVPILVHGPSGTGKTTIVNQLEQTTGWKIIMRLDSTSLGGTASKLKATLSKHFSDATACQPSLILIDRLETIAGREADSPYIASLFAEQLEQCRRTKVQVIATASRPMDLNEQLLPCFDRLIELPTPTTTARLKILSYFCGDAVSPTVLEIIADKTHAFNARDLRRLCTEADDASERRRSSTGLSDDKITFPITIQDFDSALPHIHPSLMNEIYIEVPKIHWSDIAGSSTIKSRLREDVELPLKHPHILSRLGLTLKLGTLLYGPPGCSKTLIAKALATETGLNFISVKGPELISKYVGESERNIREAFRKARAAAPSIIFFDEFDSLAPIRGGNGGHHEGVNTVPTLLTELDGVEAVTDVLVLAATNRPYAIDPALLRYGRLGTHLFVGPPDRDAILQILEMNTMDRQSADLDLGLIADRMARMGEEGNCFSGADVAAVCETAKRLHAKTILTVEAGKKGDVVVGTQQSYLLEALEGYKPSLSRALVEGLRVWNHGGNSINMM